MSFTIILGCHLLKHEILDWDNFRKGQMYRYSEDDMVKAIEEVLRGQAIARTAK